MATRVEISSTLASLTTVPDLNEIRSEDKSRRMYVSVLSDASNKTKEASASLTLEEKNKFGSTLRSATMPSLGSRPRLFPKPFSKDKSSDTFANVKPPIPAFRSSSLIRKATEETSSVKVPSGNVPPLVDQKIIGNESKAGSEVVTNMTFYTGPSANTVILFEAAGTEQSKVSLAQEKRAAEDRRVFNVLQTKELQCNVKLEKQSQPSETSRNPEGSLHRQVSLSSSLRPVSWNPLKTGEKKDAYEGHPGEKTSDDSNNISNKVDLSVDVQQRPKHRPVSAIFLESLRDQKHRAGEASEEKSPTEKSWARKPRPLSMDLTAKFEHKDLSSCKKTCSSQESKENASIISFTDSGCHDQSEMGPKTEETEINKGSSSKINLKCSSQDIGILNNGKHAWETKLKSKSEQIETKPEVMTNLRGSERSHETTSEIRTDKEGKKMDQKETCMSLACESPAASSEKENNIVRGSVKKHINLFTSENHVTAMDTEPLQSAAERENRCLNIQQRIKELTTENTDVKPGNVRRSLQSRPLSADLTKMFSSPTSSSEVKPPKSAETRNDSLSEMQENLKSKEIKLAHGTDSSEIQTTGNPWKSRQIVKITNKPNQVERNGSFLGDGRHLAQQSENTVSFTSSLEKKLKPTQLVETTYIKTVRATMFDHNVQRHNVAADQPGADSAPRVNTELEAKHDVMTLGHNRRSWMGEAEETTGIKKEYHKQSDPSKHRDVGKTSLSEDKKMTPRILLEKSLVEKGEKPTPKTAEDSLISQRIEPRYEIFQTCGERALSEAITMAPEKKAMTLRTRKSSVKESKSDGDVLHAGQTAKASSKTTYLKEDKIVLEGRDTKAFPSMSAFRESNVFFYSECTLPEQKKDADKTDTDPILTAEKTPYSTNKSKCLGVNEKVNKLHSEINTDKGEVSSVDKAERSNMMKCSSENRSFRAGGTDSYDFRTNLDHEDVLTGVDKHGVQSSSVLSSGLFCKSSSSNHPDTKALPVKEESPVFGLRKSLDLICKEQGFSLASTASENSEKIRVTDPEEKVRRTRSSVSDLKISERWRRRTLPQDSVKTEEVVWLSPENIKRLSRTDSLQLDEGWLKKRSKKIKEGVEGSEATQSALGSHDDYLKNQSSALEPKATYFAVTYQIPGTKQEKSFSSPGTSETNTVSSSSEGATINLDRVFPGRSKPLLQQPNKNMLSTSCREDLRELHISEDWVKEEDKGDIFSKNTAFGNFHTSRKENHQPHERGLDHSKEKIIDVDTLLLKQDLENTAQTDLRCSRRQVSSYHEPRSPLRFAQLRTNSELVPQKSSEKNYDLSGRKAEDGYRSQILDIDALMAEYKEESVKASSIQDKLSEDHSLFIREKSKSKRNVSDRPTSYSWKEWKGAGDYAINNKQGDHAEEYHRPEKSILSEKSKEKLESCGTEPDKQKPKDRKLSPPHWGNPSSFFSDTFVNSPVDFTRKKTFILDEDEEVNLTSKGQSPQFVIDKVQPINTVGTEQKLEVNFASRLSIKTDEGLLQKTLVTKEQFLEVSPEGEWSKNVARSSVTTSKDSANKDSSNVRSKTGWKTYTSGLGSAPPDLKRSYSEKSRQGKDNLLLMQEIRGRKDLNRCRQSFPLESVASGWKHKMTSPSESFFHEDKKASRTEWTKQSSDKTEGTNFSLVSTQRSRHSFYKDRRTDNGMDQLKQCFSRHPPEAKDTDTLVQEPDSQYGTWKEQRRSGDSFVPESPSSENDVISTRKQHPNSHPSSLSSQTEPASLVDHHDFSKDQRSTSLDRSSTDRDSTDGTDLPPLGDTNPDEKTTDFSFIDQTTILDSSALKTRVQLSKKRRRRAPISHSLRRSRGQEFENRFSLMEEPDNTWMFKDSTEEKKTMQREDSDEEDKIQHTVRTSSVHAQRLPVFPGMDHSVLKAQLRKRRESESAGEISSAQLFKSPKPQPGTPGSRVLPSSVEKEDRSEEKSPQWLKELKSKKRQSHYENQV
ncbi:uncharacterized protein KIAA1671 homolog isoform X1 [Cuculus canorus]|uniref:uncharacterized protein KIAA1671 homolog isoform X1 n=1 Tax=Cuculus canorus TaxID=55661 RepID=UPI0023AB51DC|nr:uncharacterized protein KIAA1671 homolog isoform X1 [Cuculus canorus]XP_053938057.1 uncharacterized protein KIAA1671 homolog isoform X1 [Cuculus canorus]